MFGKKTDEACDAKVQAHGFTISKKFDTWWPRFYVDDIAQKWAVIYNKKAEPFFYNYSDILDYDVVEDGGSIAHGRAGSAAVGGLLFGAAGAIVGAALPNKSDATCTSLQIVIHVNDLNNPTIVYSFIESETSRSSYTYDLQSKTAQKVAGMFDYMIAKARESKESAAKAPDAADELRKFKQLLDDGVITSEDFENKKKQLLGI